MVRTQSRLGVTQRDMNQAQEASPRPQSIFVVPYNSPWYYLLLKGVLNITRADGSVFAVKTGSVPKKHRGWVGFYNSKSRVRPEVVARHRLSPHDLHLGELVGVGRLMDSRELTDHEKYQWYLAANKITNTDVDRLYYKWIKAYPEFSPEIGRQKLSISDKVKFLGLWLSDSFNNEEIITGPMPIGHFYHLDSLKRFPKPVAVKYPQGPVQGTAVPLTPEIRQAISAVGLKPQDLR